MSILGVTYGTVESGKEEIVYMSSIVLAKKYNVNYLLVRPDVIEDEKIIKRKKRTFYSKYAFKFSNFFKAIEKNKDYVIHVQYFHLFDLEELKTLVRFFRKFNFLVNFIGLKRDYSGEIYPQWKYLYEITDLKEELESHCVFCGRKATHNQALIEDEPVPYLAPNAKILLNLNYVPVCENCFVEPKEVSEDIAYRYYLIGSNRQS